MIIRLYRRGVPTLAQSGIILSYHFERMRRGTPRLYNNNNIYKMKILLFDNYDSFTYNLLHILKELGADVEVHRNDKISLEEIERFDKILLSPGPGIPEEAGILLPLIRRYAPTKSILGVCLGEQAIGEAFGATLINLTDVHHGVCSDIRIVKSEAKRS